MKTPARLTVVETPPASAEAVARMMQAAKAGGRALALTMADELDAMAARAAELSAAGDAVSPGVRDLAARMADDMAAKAQTIRKLA